MGNIAFTSSGETIQVVADFDATAQRLWQLFEDPRQLEQWWGPPMWPATFSRFEFQPEGSARYHMTGPDGTASHGWWQFHSTSFPVVEFTDGFSDSEGVPDPALPTNRTRVEISDVDGRGQIRFTSVYESEEDLNRVLEMGMQEGMTLALGQIDAVLAAS